MMPVTNFSKPFLMGLWPGRFPCKKIFDKKIRKSPIPRLLPGCYHLSLKSGLFQDPGVSLVRAGAAPAGAFSVAAILTLAAGLWHSGPTAKPGQDFRWRQEALSGDCFSTRSWDILQGKSKV